MFCAPLGEDEADEEADDEGENAENEKYPMLAVALNLFDADDRVDESDDCGLILNSYVSVVVRCC